MIPEATTIIMTMTTRFAFPLLLLLLCSSTVVRASHGGDSTSLVGFDFETLSTPLPEALSDFTAVLDEENGRAYLAGGCNAPDGNRFAEDVGGFVCESISSKMYIFDLVSWNFTETASPMPVARYRHASVFVNNQVWLVGGRDLEDFLLPSVDVSLWCFSALYRECID